MCCVEGEEEGEQEYFFEDRNRKFVILGDGEDFNLENQEKDIVIVAKPEGNKLKIEFYARSYPSAYKAKDIANNFVNNGDCVENRIFKNNYEDGKLKKVCELKYPSNLILEQAVIEGREKEIIKECIMRRYLKYPDNHLKII